MVVVVEAKEGQQLGIVDRSGEESRGGQEELLYEVERHGGPPVSPTRSTC